MKKLISILLMVILTMSFAFAQEQVANEYRMSALVTDVGDGSFTVSWADGRQYAFAVSPDTDMNDLSSGLKAGETVFISYTGEIDWEMADASGVKVDYISDGDMDEIDYISGVVTDGANSTVTVKWANGHEYTFIKGNEADTSGLGDDGLSIGDAIKIGYIGYIDWETDDTSAAHVVSIEKGEPEVVNTLTGIIYDAAMHSFSVEADDGEIYSFTDEGDADKSGLPDGLALDERVTVSFVGSLEYIDYAHLISVVKAE